MTFYLSTDVGGKEWIPFGRLPEVNGKKGKLLMTESPISRVRRAVWKSQNQSYVDTCPCTYWRRDRNFHRRLFEFAEHMMYVKRNEPIPESDLNDDLDGI